MSTNTVQYDKFRELKLFSVFCFPVTGITTFEMIRIGKKPSYENSENFKYHPSS
jgi:hypothetical protein